MRYVSLVLLGMLVSMLAGCGGGDDGAKRSLEEDLALVQADLDAAQTELATTKETLATTQDTLTTTEADLATAQAELATTKATLATREETLASTQEDLAEANDDLEDKEAELTTTQAALTMAQSELDTAEDELTTTKISLATANANLANAQANLITAQANVTAAENDLAEKTTELTTTQGDLTTANANLATARMDLATARMDLMTAQDDLTAETTKLLTAQADLKTAQDTLATVRGTLTSTETALTTARARVSTLEGQVTRLQGQVTTLTNTVAQLRGQVQTGNTILEDRLSEAEQANVNARAGKYLEAINDGGDERMGVSVRYQRGSSLMIDPGGNFVSGSGAPGISGFTARTYTRQVGVTGNQTVYLYTNIQAPGTRAFWKVHGLEVMAAQGVTALKPTPGGTPSFINDPDDPLLADGLRVGGTFDGVSGTFECTTGNCMDAKDQITRSEFVVTTNGVRSFATGSTWDFKPTSINSGVRQNEDTEHLYFGIWVNEPNVASTDHGFNHIVGGSMGTLSAGALTGTAEFRGGAVGKYVTRNQVGENAAIGTFTAAVNFTADFDDDTLEGRIDNFRDGSRSLTGWNAYLGTSATAPAAFTGAGVTGQHVEASIGGVQAMGDWDASLRGIDNTDLMNTDDHPYTRYPRADLAGIVGNFFATDDETDVANASVAIAGTFGATPR